MAAKLRSMSFAPRTRIAVAISFSSTAPAKAMARRPATRVTEEAAQWATPTYLSSATLVSISSKSDHAASILFALLSTSPVDLCSLGRASSARPDTSSELSAAHAFKLNSFSQAMSWSSSATAARRDSSAQTCSQRLHGGNCTPASLGRGLAHTAAPQPGQAKDRAGSPVPNTSAAAHREHLHSNCHCLRSNARRFATGCARTSSARYETVISSPGATIRAATTSMCPGSGPTLWMAFGAHEWLTRHNPS
mmetsp:Transcript_6113/g.15139  ORF Transcript_6113/g.15139 Transcript_6113/m.15139 type:complete len:250 (+) Transcript_6113:185-934(+)